MRKKTLLIYMLILQLFLTFAPFIHEAQALTIPGPAPDFTLTDIDGNTFSLSGNVGHRILLTFFYCGCSPCQIEAGTLKEVWSHFLGSDLVMISVSIVEYDTPAQMQLFRQYYGGPWLMANEGPGHAVSKSYGVSEVPHNFIIDAEGTVRRELVGALTTAKEFIDELDKLAGTQIWTTVFAEDFEAVAWPRSWICGDWDSTSGLDYWGRDHFTGRTGVDSGWCAQVSDHPFGLLSYDTGMSAYMYRTISLSAYGSAEYGFWFLIDSTPGQSGLYVIWRIGTSWQTMLITNGGHSDTWEYRSVSIPKTADAVGFLFSSSRSSPPDGYGVTVDDIKLIAKEKFDVTIRSWDYESGEQPLSVPIKMDGWPTGYNTPHTFTAVSGTHNFTVTENNMAGHPFSDWDTGWTDETITVSSPGTYTARYRKGYSATIWSLDYTSGWDDTLPITLDGVLTTWTTPHTFTDLSNDVIHNITVPSGNAAGQPFTSWEGCSGWQTYWTNTTLTFGNAGVYTATYGTPAPLEVRKVSVTLNFGADLHIYDQLGRHVGYNYETFQDEIQIPGATYTGRGEIPQIITIPITEELRYAIEVVGTTSSPYELRVEAVNDEDVVMAERIFTGTVRPRQVFPYRMEIGTLPEYLLSMQPMTSLTTSLEVGQPQFTNGTNVFVTSDTPFTLHTIGGSGAVSTDYRVFGDDYDSGWKDYTEPFQIAGVADGTYNINYNSSDSSDNPENVHTSTVILDDTSPLLTVEAPTEDEAVQDGITFKVSAWDLSAVATVTFSIQCPQGNIISPEFQSMSATLGSDSKWSLYFDTRQLPDGSYMFVANGTDVLGNWGTETVHFSIRNWAAMELLPASESNKAGRTMPVKFSLRVKASVDPAQPFIRNEELTIKIYRKGYPGTILQTSTYGTSSTDYRIDPVSEKYITNFKTLSTPTTYVVEIWRKGVLIGSFEFKTVK